MSRYHGVASDKTLLDSIGAIRELEQWEEEAAVAYVRKHNLDNEAEILQMLALEKWI